MRPGGCLCVLRKKSQAARETNVEIGETSQKPLPSSDCLQFEQFPCNLDSSGVGFQLSEQLRARTENEEGGTLSK
jgi:hypothetical protein